MNSEFRPARPDEREQILSIYQDGAAALAQDGVDQWQGATYPSYQDIDSHMGKDLYVMIVDATIVATATLQQGVDPDYEAIEGTWHTQKPYISIHKVAVKATHRGRGQSKVLLQHIETFATDANLDLRIDTHCDNFKMRKLVESCGYRYCGQVILSGNLHRLAFDKKIRTN